MKVKRIEVSKELPLETAQRLAAAANKKYNNCVSLQEGDRSYYLMVGDPRAVQPIIDWLDANGAVYEVADGGGTVEVYTTKLTVCYGVAEKDLPRAAAVGMLRSIAAVMAPLPVYAGATRLADGFYWILFSNTHQAKFMELLLKEKGVRFRQSNSLPDGRCPDLPEVEPQAPRPSAAAPAAAPAAQREMQQEARGSQQMRDFLGRYRGSVASIKGRLLRSLQRRRSG